MDDGSIEFKEAAEAHEVFSSADGIVLQTLEAKAEADKRPRGSSFISMDMTCSARRSARPSRRPTCRP